MADEPLRIAAAANLGAAAAALPDDGGDCAEGGGDCAAGLVPDDRPLKEVFASTQQAVCGIIDKSLSDCARLLGEKHQDELNLVYVCLKGDVGCTLKSFYELLPEGLERNHSAGEGEAAVIHGLRLEVSAAHRRAEVMRQLQNELKQQMITKERSLQHIRTELWRYVCMLKGQLRRALERDPTAVDATMALADVAPGAQSLVQGLMSEHDERMHALVTKLEEKMESVLRVGSVASQRAHQSRLLAKKLQAIEATYKAREERLKDEMRAEAVKTEQQRLENRAYHTQLFGQDKDAVFVLAFAQTRTEEAGARGAVAAAEAARRDAFAAQLEACEEAGAQARTLAEERGMNYELQMEVVELEERLRRPRRRLVTLKHSAAAAAEEEEDETLLYIDLREGLCSGDGGSASTQRLVEERLDAGGAEDGLRLVLEVGLYEDGERVSTVSALGAEGRLVHPTCARIAELLSSAKVSCDLPRRPAAPPVDAAAAGSSSPAAAGLTLPDDARPVSAASSPAVRQAAGGAAALLEASNAARRRADIAEQLGSVGAGAGGEGTLARHATYTAGAVRRIKVRGSVGGDGDGGGVGSSSADSWDEAAERAVDGLRRHRSHGGWGADEPHPDSGSEWGDSVALTPRGGRFGDDDAATTAVRRGQSRVRIDVGVERFGGDYSGGGGGGGGRGPLRKESSRQNRGSLRKISRRVSVATRTASELGRAGAQAESKRGGTTTTSARQVTSPSGRRRRLRRKASTVDGGVAAAATAAAAARAASDAAAAAAAAASFSEFEKHTPFQKMREEEEERKLDDMVTGAMDAVVDASSGEASLALSRGGSHRGVSSPHGSAGVRSLLGSQHGSGFAADFSFAADAVETAEAGTQTEERTLPPTPTQEQLASVAEVSKMRHVVDVWREAGARRRRTLTPQNPPSPQATPSAAASATEELASVASGNTAARNGTPSSAAATTPVPPSESGGRPSASPESAARPSSGAAATGAAATPDAASPTPVATPQQSAAAALQQRETAVVSAAPSEAGGDPASPSTAALVGRGAVLEAYMKLPRAEQLCETLAELRHLAVCGVKGLLGAVSALARLVLRDGGSSLLGDVGEEAEWPPLMLRLADNVSHAESFEDVRTVAAALKEASLSRKWQQRVDVVRGMRIEVARPLQVQQAMLQSTLTVADDESVATQDEATKSLLDEVLLANTPDPATVEELRIGTGAACDKSYTSMMQTLRAGYMRRLHKPPSAGLPATVVRSAGGGGGAVVGLAESPLAALGGSGSGAELSLLPQHLCSDAAAAATAGTSTAGVTAKPVCTPPHPPRFARKLSPQNSSPQAGGGRRPVSANKWRPITQSDLSLSVT